LPHSTTPANSHAPGVFIALEGIDGAGKTTQAKRLSERLSGLWPDRQIVLLHEPGSTALGERIRRLVKEARGTAIEPVAELLLFAAARAQLVGEVITPALTAGAIVLCDRFTASTRAYQGFGRGIDPNVIDQVEAVATGGVGPDINILFDVDVETALGRMKRVGARDRFESEDVAFYRQVRAGYLSAAQQRPDRWVVLDAGVGAGAVTKAMWAQVAGRLGVA